MTALGGGAAPWEAFNTWLFGSTLKIITLNDEMIEGEIYTVDTLSKSLIIRK